MTRWTKSWDTLLFSGIALLIVLGLGGSFLAYYLNPVNAEMRRLQGDWELVRTAENGKEPRAGSFQRICRVRGDRVSIVSDEEREFCRIQINPRVVPKEIDLISQDKRRKQEERILGIYELDGDDLAVCFCSDPSEFKSLRPTEISGKNGAFVAYFKRKK